MDKPPRKVGRPKGSTKTKDPTELTRQGALRRFKKAKYDPIQRNLDSIKEYDQIIDNILKRGGGDILPDDKNLYMQVSKQRDLLHDRLMGYTLSKPKQEIKVDSTSKKETMLGISIQGTNGLLPLKALSKEQLKELPGPTPHVIEAEVEKVVDDAR